MRKVLCVYPRGPKYANVDQVCQWDIELINGDSPRFCNPNSPKCPIDKLLVRLRIVVTSGDLCCHSLVVFIMITNAHMRIQL